MSEQEHGPPSRRRRRRATAEVGLPPAHAAESDHDTIHDTAPDAVPESRSGGDATTPSRRGGRADSPKRTGKKSRADAAERGLQSLVGAGPSQLGVSGALRGRDVNRPTDADQAEAERDVVIVRRHWKPPA